MQLPLYNPDAYIFADHIPLFYYFSFTQNFVMAAHGHFGPYLLAQTWSLAVEEQFYLLIPLIIYFTDKRKLPYVIGLFILIAPIFRAFSTNYAQAYTLLSARMDSPAMGVLLAWMLEKSSVETYIRQHISMIRTFSLVLVPVCFGLYISGFAGMFAHTLVGFISWLVLLHCLFSPDTWLIKPLRGKVLVGLGNISYFVYLFHQPVNGLMHLVILGQKFPLLDSSAAYVITLAGLILTLRLGMLSYRFIEKPLVRYGHRFQVANGPITSH